MEQQQRIQNSNVGETATLQPAANVSKLNFNVSTLVKWFQSQPDPLPPYNALFSPGDLKVKQAQMGVRPKQRTQSQSLHNIPLSQSGSQGDTPTAAPRNSSNSPPQQVLQPASCSHAESAQSTHGRSLEGSISRHSAGRIAGSQSSEKPPSQPPQSTTGAPQQGNQPFNPQLQAWHLPQGNPMQMQSFPHYQPLSSAQQGGMQYNPPVNQMSTQGVDPQLFAPQSMQGVKPHQGMQGVNPQLFAPQYMQAVNPQSVQQPMQGTNMQLAAQPMLGVNPQLFAPPSAQGVNPQYVQQPMQGVNLQLAAQSMQGGNLPQAMQRINPQSVPQPMQQVNLQSVPQFMEGDMQQAQDQHTTWSFKQPILTPAHSLEDIAEDNLSSEVDTALFISRVQPSVKARTQRHEKPKGPPVKERKKTNRLSQEIRSRFESEPIMMCVQSPHTKPRLAEQVMKQCSCDTKVKPLTYVLDMTPDKSKKKLSMIEKYTFGPRPRSRITNRVLMIVGATGAGKTTLINGMINYIFGVRWEDTFRFKMVVENPVTQAESVTQKITAYTIYHQEGATINFSLTIVDTPGFGDTKGIERDKRIVSQIKDFFSLSPSEGGVDHLDAIGFVAQASLARLTPTQRYIFDSILSVFGKNVGSNIFMMITFADGKKPPVVDAIKAANIPYRKFFKFNNSAIYPHSEQTYQDAFGSSGEEDDGGDFSHMFWDMGMKSFENFFTRFKVVEPQSLQLTNEVLKERQRLETTINSLQPQINEGLAKIEELRHEE